MTLTTIKNHNKVYEKPGNTVTHNTFKKNNVAQPNDLLFDETEFDFAANHLNRIKSLSIKQQDVVLVAIPMSEKSWLEVIDACIYTGADFVMIDPISEATSLAEIIKREKVTVVATTMQIWTHIYRQLNAKSVENKSLRIIRYNDRGEPESRRQVLRAMSK
jgi:acyl-CoA synthetase (AMP-forming)/AMP-acid ligase II